MAFSFPTTGFDPALGPQAGIFLLFLVVLLTHLIRLYFFHGLSHIPGPPIAKICNIWKLNAALRAKMPRKNIDLHRTYGPLVRIGPNMVSVDDPEALSVIYGFQKVFPKACAPSEFSRPKKITVVGFRC